MSKLRTDRSESGFTLVEVLIALSIFAIGLLALASMQVTALRGNATSQEVTVATALAEGTLERLLSLNSDNAIFDASSASEDEMDDSPYTIEGAGTMRAFYSVDANPGGFPPNVVRINVRVVTNGGREVSFSGLKRRTVE